MSRTLSLLPDIEVQPDESASQIIFWNPSDNDGNQFDIQDNIVMSSNDQRSAFQMSKPQSNRVSKSLSSFFIITADTEKEERKFLKESYINFKFRLQESRSKSRGSEHWQHYNEGIHRTTGVPYCLCKYCHDPVMHPNTISTGPIISIARHYPKCKQYNTSIRRNSQSTVSSYFQSTTFQAQEE